MLRTMASKEAVLLNFKAVDASEIKRKKNEQRVVHQCEAW
jgi:hypothetical protein